MTLADAMSSLTVSGTGDTIVSKGGDVITIASGQAGTGHASDTLNAAGPDTIMLGNNVNLSVDGSGHVITAAGNNAITGSGNTISLTGAGSSITGDNNAMSGSNTTVDLSQGNDDTLSGDNDTILGNNETLTLKGTGNTVAAW